MHTHDGRICGCAMVHKWHHLYWLSRSVGLRWWIEFPTFRWKLENINKLQMNREIQSKCLSQNEIVWELAPFRVRWVKIVQFNFDQSAIAAFVRSFWFHSICFFSNLEFRHKLVVTHCSKQSKDIWHSEHLRDYWRLPFFSRSDVPFILALQRSVPVGQLPHKTVGKKNKGIPF